NVEEMNRELVAVCGAAGLVYDCGCGGNLNSTIALVAEAPGEREGQQKQPLIGSSGRLVWDVLRRYGLTRNSVYSTNVVKRKLVSTADAHAVSTRDAKLVLPKGEIVMWRHILMQELSRLPNLKYVNVLGNYALDALSGCSGILKYRGSILPCAIDGRTVQVLCTLNPAYILREPKLEVVFRMDLDKLGRMRDGKIHAPPITCHINPTA